MCHSHLHCHMAFRPEPSAESVCPAYRQITSVYTPRGHHGCLHCLLCTLQYSCGPACSPPPCVASKPWDTQQCLSPDLHHSSNSPTPVVSSCFAAVTSCRCWATSIQRMQPVQPVVLVASQRHPPAAAMAVVATLEAGAMVVAIQEATLVAIPPTGASQLCGKSGAVPLVGLGTLGGACMPLITACSAGLHCLPAVAGLTDRKSLTRILPVSTSSVLLSCLLSCPQGPYCGAQPTHHRPRTHVPQHRPDGVSWRRNGGVDGPRHR